MSAPPITQQLGTGRRPSELAWWGAIPLAAAWSAVVIAAKLGYASVPNADEILLAPPIALVALLVMSRAATPLPLKLVAAWTGMLAGALLAAPIIASKPTYALAVPAVAVAAATCAKRPVLAVGLLFLLAGTYNTVLALTPVPVYQVTDVLVAGLLLAAVWMLLFGRTERPAWIRIGVIAVGAYVVLSALQILLADDINIARDSYHASIFYMLAVIPLAYAPWKPGTSVRLARAFLVVGLGVAGYATLRWIIGPAAAEQAQALSVNAAFNYVNGHLVLFGSFPTGHHLAAWTAEMLPFCAALAIAMSGRWRLVAVLACGLCGAALLGSEVRAGVAGLFVGLAVVVVLVHLSRAFPGPRLGTLGLILGGLATIAAIAVLTQGSSSRYTNILHPGRDPAYQARVYKWSNALADISRNPLGHSLGTSGEAQGRLGRFVTIQKFDIDNSYLKIALDQGVPMLLLFGLATLGVMAGLGLRAVRTEDKVKAGIAIGACGALVSFLVVIFTGLYTEGLTALTAWMLVGLGLAQFARLPGAAASERAAAGSVYSPLGLPEPSARGD